MLGAKQLVQPGFWPYHSSHNTCIFGLAHNRRFNPLFTLTNLASNDDKYTLTGEITDYANLTHLLELSDINAALTPDTLIAEPFVTVAAYPERPSLADLNRRALARESYNRTPSRLCKCLCCLYKFVVRVFCG